MFLTQVTTPSHGTVVSYTVVLLLFFCLEFNAVTQTCIQDLVPAILRHLNLPKPKGREPVLPSSSPQWKKIRLHVKTYVSDVIEVMLCCVIVRRYETSSVSPRRL